VENPPAAIIPTHKTISNNFVFMKTPLEREVFIIPAIREYE
jgi:hypothetical protein